MKNLAKIPTPKKILVVIIKDMGDVIITEPVAQILRANFPNAEIDFVAQDKYAPVLEGNPDINHIIIYDKKHPLKAILEVRKAKYDWVLDFLSNPRSAMITALSGAKLKAGNEKNVHKFYAYNFAFKYPQEPMYNADLKLNWLKQLGLKWYSDKAPLAKYYLTQEHFDYRKKAYDSLGFKDTDFIVGFYATPGYPTRKWPAESFRQTALELNKKYNAKIIVFWGPGEKEAAEEIVKDMPDFVKLSPKTQGIWELCALLSRLNLMVACCGGTKHLALAVGVPTISINTFSSGKSWTPQHKNHIYLQAATDCSPCYKFECPYNLKCMGTVTVKNVMKAAQTILGG